MFRLKLFLMSLTKKMWPKVTGFAVLAVLTALAALILRNYVPDGPYSDFIRAETVNSILSIIASTMLAVTTFSLSTMVSAYSAATNATPRATKLVMEDSTTQNVLATFLGSFVFSLVGIITINLNIYSGNGLLVVFIMTMLLIILIIGTFIRWIEHLRKLGRLKDTTRLVENEAVKAMEMRRKAPYLRANPLEDIPEDLYPIKQAQYGYIQYIDIEKLNIIGKENDLNIYIICLPGAFVGPASIIAFVSTEVDDRVSKQISSSVVIGDERNYEQDPRFGLCVLNEIATKALSTAINDTGTVIDVIGRLVRVLAIYADVEQEPEVKYERIWVPSLSIEDLFADAFAAIYRDGAVYEIYSRLLKGLKMLYAVDNSLYQRQVEEYVSMSMQAIQDSAMSEPEKAALINIFSDA